MGNAKGKYSKRGQDIPAKETGRHQVDE